MRTLLLTALFLTFTCPPLVKAAGPLTVSGPPSAESIPLIAMAQPNRPWEQDFEVRFIPWHSPDMLRAMVAGEQVDAAIITTASASTLHNRGVNCRMVLLYDSPVWIVSTTSGPDTLQSLKGTLLFPFGPGEMPELFYKAAMVNTPGGITTRYTGGAIEAVNLLLAGRGDHAMLNEPIASIAVERSKIMHAKGAPLLIKRVNMCRVWERTFPGHHLAASCMSFFGAKADDPELMQAFRKAHEQACLWVEDNPGKARDLVQKKLPALDAYMEAGIYDTVEIHTLNGQQAQEDALFYLKKISEISPAAVGGTLPGEAIFEAKQ
ncbi:ABC transporter substrate-binding protein [Pseudodesulfovibrio sediminis]|uniref:ABC transporter substrate-binding protein n=1 Tax=Pseudodesulfovibrio sediminis TaxID=2810563 RepID=A0ABM7P442_9BACT|nr:hypothetical protein [Pseudodesulfovibrio sediminis]BCS87626.1 hypothetical protein PSDVSF_08680 [Pseudodesulfovibrio sediminis]